MLASMLVVFREVFEMAIVICVILAATKGLRTRGQWVIAGIIGGTLGASLLAILVREFSFYASGVNKNVFNAFILLVIAALLGLSIVWMKKHGRELVTNLNKMGAAIVDGKQHMVMLAVVVGLAVLREGSEIVLFLYGIIELGDNSLLSVLQGSVLGLLLGLAFGVLMYFGLLRIPVKYLFSVTSWLLTLIACGIVTNAVGKFVQAGWLPALSNPIWDSSVLLSQHSLLGRFLHTLIGYIDKPSGIQVLMYLSTFLIIAYLPKLMGKIKNKNEVAY